MSTLINAITFFLELKNTQEREKQIDRERRELEKKWESERGRYAVARSEGQTDRDRQTERDRQVYLCGGVNTRWSETTWIGQYNYCILFWGSLYIMNKSSSLSNYNPCAHLTVLVNQLEVFFDCSTIDSSGLREILETQSSSSFHWRSISLDRYLDAVDRSAAWRCSDRRCELLWHWSLL